MPLPGTRVVHARWAERNRPTANGTQTATCTITTGTGAGWTPEAGATAGTATTHYAGTCSVSEIARSVALQDAAGQLVEPHGYYVGVKDDAADIPAGARVHIDTADDPRLVGKDLVVTSSTYDSLLLERVLVCKLDAANQGG